MNLHTLHKSCYYMLNDNISDLVYQYMFDKKSMCSRGMLQAGEAAPASAEAWRMCEGVCSTVERVSVLQGLQAADSVDSSVLQVRSPLWTPGRGQRTGVPLRRGRDGPTGLGQQKRRVQGAGAWRTARELMLARCWEAITAGAHSAAGRRYIALQLFFLEIVSAWSESDSGSRSHVMVGTAASSSLWARSQCPVRGTALCAASRCAVRQPAVWRLSPPASEADGFRAVAFHAWPERHASGCRFQPDLVCCGPFPAAVLL